MTTPVIPADTIIRINRAWAAPKERTDIPVVDPRTGQQLATIAGGGPADAAAAVDAARTAAPGWAETSPEERAAILHQMADAMDGAAGEELAELTSLEIGKRLVESKAELALTQTYFRYYADAIASLTSAQVRVREGVVHHVHEQPVGVVAAVNPWNFPLSIPGRKLAPALAAGCPVVFKPSEVVPRTSQRLMEILDPLVPEGVLTMVAGDGKAIVESLVDDQRVRAMSFTGSTRVGRSIAVRGAERFLRFVLELGGASPFVVLPDADLSTAIDTLAMAKYRNNGQSCIAANTAWVPESRYDEVLDAFVAKSAGLQVGDPLDDATGLGPLGMTSDPSRLRGVVEKIVPSSVIAADLPGDLDGGNWLAPIVVRDPDGTELDADDEMFGPVLSFRKYRDLDDVLEQVRAQQRGLGGYVVGSDLEYAAQVASRLDVGILGVNNGAPAHPAVPFAGRNHSGMGIEGSVAGMEQFLMPQTVAVAS